VKKVGPKSRTNTLFLAIMIEVLCFIFCLLILG